MDYQEINLEFKNKFFNLVENAQNILITSHIHPDDDSIGSVLSTYSFLSEKYPNKKTKIIYSQEFSDTWAYFENFDKIESVDDIANIINEFDLIIFLDSCEYNRFSDFPEKINIFISKNSNLKTICLDHHANQSSQFNLLLKNIDASSTTEFIYFLFGEDLAKISSRICETLLLGILGDTGYLQFIRPSQSHIFSVVQRLVTDGAINIQTLKSKYSTYSEKVFKIIQEYVRNSQTKKIPNWPKFFYSFIEKDFIIQGRFTDIEISTASHIFIQTFATALTETSWGMKINPDLNGDISISLRSRPGSVIVKDIVQQMEIGGGHDRAAGGTFKKVEKDLTVSGSFEKIFDWMRKHEPTLS